MSSGEDDGFIAPPPGIAPKPDPAPAQPEPVTAEVISLPPGVVDSGTYRMPPTRAPKPSSPDDAPAFFPTSAPGLPPVEASSAAEVDDATRVAVGRRSAPVWRLTLPLGDQLMIEQPTLIGRDPAVNSQWPDAALVPVIDPGKTVSKTHAAVQLADGGVLLVHDLDSTNGVYLRLPSGDEADVRPGEPQQLEPGTELVLGDYVIAVDRS